MNARRQRLGKWELGALILCGAFVLLTVGAVGESGRNRAKEVVCRANLRQWHDILQSYIDPNGGFIHGDKGTPGYWWIRYLSEEHKDWKRTKIWFCPRAVKPVMLDNGIQKKPSPTSFAAWGIYQGDGLGPNGVSGSYGLNGYVIPIGSATTQWTVTYEGGVPARAGWQDLRDVPNANTVPMFLEALRFDLWPLATNPPASDEGVVWSWNMMARCCVNRHDGAVNGLFVDGSVRKVGLKKVWTLKWHRTFNTAGPWTKAGGVMPSDWPRWMEPFKDY